MPAKNNPNGAPDGSESRAERIARNASRAYLNQGPYISAERSDVQNTLGDKKMNGPRHRRTIIDSKVSPFREFLVQVRDQQITDPALIDQIESEINQISKANSGIVPSQKITEFLERIVVGYQQYFRAGKTKQHYQSDVLYAGLQTRLVQFLQADKDREAKK